MLSFIASKKNLEYIMENKNSDNALIKLLLVLAHADEHYHVNEEKLIKKICNLRNIDSTEYDKILITLFKNKKNYKSICLEVLKDIKSKDDRENALRALSDLAAADYILHEDEMLLLQLIADEWGMYRKKIIE